MLGLGILFGLVVLGAGGLVALGLIAQNRLVLAAGFLLMAACAIFGTQPGWPFRSRDDRAG